jgi:hypothetical protein
MVPVDLSGNVSEVMSLMRIADEFAASKKACGTNEGLRIAGQEIWDFLVQDAVAHAPVRANTRIAQVCCGRMSNLLDVVSSKRRRSPTCVPRSNFKSSSGKTAG